PKWAFFLTAKCASPRPRATSRDAKAVLPPTSISADRLPSPPLPSPARSSIRKRSCMGVDLNRVIRGRVWKFGDSIETDAINPYYRYPTMAELKLHTMEAYRPAFPREVRPGDVLVAGRNFGCGSSRPGLVLREVG